MKNSIKYRFEWYGMIFFGYGKFVEIFRLKEVAKSMIFP
jgi:hypothetical protein